MQLYMINETGEIVNKKQLIEKAVENDFAMQLPDTCVLDNYLATLKQYNDYLKEHSNDLSFLGIDVQPITKIASDHFEYLGVLLVSRGGVRTSDTCVIYRGFEFVEA